MAEQIETAEHIKMSVICDDQITSKIRTATNIVLLYTFLAALLILIGLTYGMYAGLFACIWPIFWCAGNGVQ
jgi:hypothetical protein